MDANNLVKAVLKLSIHTNHINAYSKFCSWSSTKYFFGAMGNMSDAAFLN